ncbi:antibiotic biosynthesis monooxygenase [Crossiella sp. SN42]|uniref:putative quinol monooxygenase n=1 Tax=Crossiella sp. SN42 TaxID=2944808 RepID=UPI00207D61C7|nr:antibiotic biosynthesis monooxygenase [Crossiella sp. SN42]MCO1581560.1 antibiotic biosynthesis monooxygenase [Crossiella sp. SN42]
MIIIAGWLDVDPETRDAYLRDCLPAIELARAAHGCHAFVLAPDPLLPGRITVFERWECDEDLARFRGDGPDSAQTAQIRDASVARYRVSAVEEP